MSLNKTMKDHMDAVRGVTGVSGLLNMTMATDALNAVVSFPYHGLINDDTKGISDIDFNSLVENGYYHINTVKLQNMPSEAQTWGTLYNFAPMGVKGYGIRIFVTSNKGIFATSYNVKPLVQIRVINPVLSAFKRVVTPLIGGVAYVA